LPSTVTTSPLAFDVPWISRKPATLVSLSRPLPRAAARLYTGNDISAAVDSSQGAGQSTLVIVYDLTNISHSTCMLGGYPTSVVATEPGLPHVRALHTRFTQAVPPGNVAPGKYGILVLYARSAAVWNPLRPQLSRHASTTVW
jgi:hypothetical protein